jgi:PRC-barrel domain
MTLELRGSARPTLQQALRWIGSRVDDIYGASIGKLEDIWMDPDSGEPLWLLVRDGRIGGRHTLVPFAQAASGAGHVWIPFEREVVRGAPAVRPSAPLSHELSDTLRRYYAESGHPVGGGTRADDALRASPEAAPVQERVAEQVVSQAATTSTGQTRGPAPPPPEPPRHEPRRHPAWAQASAERAPVAEPPPLPPLPPRPSAPAPEERFAAPRQQERSFPRSYEAPPPPPREPLRPDEVARQRQMAQPPPPPPQRPPAAQRPPKLEELRLSVGDGVDMELVGRLQFRGNVVRMQPLRPDAETRT